MVLARLPGCRKKNMLMIRAITGFTCMLTFIAMASAQTAAPEQLFDLKGEAPGLTLKEFKAHHRHADCTNSGSHKTTCQEFKDVSFAGVSALSWKGCLLPECRGQGIFATFVDGRLVSLMYGVAPYSSKEIIKTLKAKFGAPTEETEQSATWRNSVGYLSVSDIVVTDKNGKPEHLATSITTATNDQGSGKDI
jgi:hypothetical protein